MDSYECLSFLVPSSPLQGIDQERVGMTSSMAFSIHRECDVMELDRQLVVYDGACSRIDDALVNHTSHCSSNEASKAQISGGGSPRDEFSPAGFSCTWPGCLSSFTRPSDLQRHENSIHLLNRLRCIECDKTFGRTDKLRKHLRGIHPKLQENDISNAIAQAKSNAETSATDSFIATSIGDYLSNASCHPLSEQSSQFLPYDSTMVVLPTQGCHSLREKPSGTSDNVSSASSIVTRSKASYKTKTGKECDTASLSGRGQDEHPQRLFACPYHKHDRQRYNSHRYGSCASSGWKNISRLK
jgi:hypothetical protein